MRISPGTAMRGDMLARPAPRQGLQPLSLCMRSLSSPRKLLFNMKIIIRNGIRNKLLIRSCLV